MSDRMIRSMFAVIVAFALAAFSGTALSAQTIATGDAQPFLGTWELPIDAGQPATLIIDIWDEDGQAAAAVTGMAGTPTPVTRITKMGEAIVLAYDADLQGQRAPIEIRLVQEGDDLHATVDVADGMMTLDGTATREEQE